MKKIDIQVLISETYMYAVIIAIAAVALAFIVANVIKWGGGKNDTSHIKRRMWYIIIGVATPIAFFLYNSMYVILSITKHTKPASIEKFKIANVWATLALLGIYAALGIITMLIMRRSKWGSILGKSKK